MKKKLLLGGFVAVIFAVAMISTSSTSSLSADLLLSNVEALSAGEYEDVSGCETRSYTSTQEGYCMGSGPTTLFSTTCYYCFGMDSGSCTTGCVTSSNDCYGSWYSDSRSQSNC